MSATPLRIVIPGGNGQVGRLLSRHFHAAGHAMTVITRFPSPAPWPVAHWDAHTLGAWKDELDGADVVINLAGRSVNCRYHAANRREILESRVRTTRLVGEAISQANQPPPLWLNASTATIYRHSLDRDMDEVTGELGGSEPDAPSTWNFSIDVAKRWEEALFTANTPATRRIALRSAMTMSPDPGGIFSVLLGLVRAGLGGTAASGEQYISWIHEHDFIAALEFLVAHTEFDGPVNLSAPEPMPNRDFMHVLRDAWGTPIGLPATRWMLEIGAVFLRTETELILKSRRVVPGRLLSAGFAFQFPDWPTAAEDLVQRWRQRQGQTS